MKIVLLVFGSCFVLTQFVFIVFILIKKEGLDWFQTQALVVIGFLLVLCNICIMVFYFRFTGSPYISDKHYKNVRYIGIIATYWSISLIGKLIQAAFP